LTGFFLPLLSIRSLGTLSATAPTPDRGNARASFGLDLRRR